jgi:hypothetical protein
VDGGGGVLLQCRGVRFHGLQKRMLGGENRLASFKDRGRRHQLGSSLGWANITVRTISNAYNRKTMQSPPQTSQQPRAHLAYLAYRRPCLVCVRGSIGELEPQLAGGVTYARDCSNEVDHCTASRLDHRLNGQGLGIRLKRNAASDVASARASQLLSMAWLGRDRNFPPGVAARR